MSALLFINDGEIEYKNKSKKHKRHLSRFILLIMAMITAYISVELFRTFKFEVNEKRIFPDFKNINEIDQISFQVFHKAENYLIVDDFSKYSDVIKLKKLEAHLGVDQESFESWYENQSKISFRKLLENVGDSNFNNGNFQGTDYKEGVMIASPSHQDPDYFYNWVRDSAICMDTISKETFKHANVNTTLGLLLLKYVNTTFDIQRVNNLSGGNCHSELCKGLGEPKWYVNNMPYDKPWGRPQSDGPALRAIAIVKFLTKLGESSNIQELIKQNDGKQLYLNFRNEKDVFENVIMQDVRYVCLNWKQVGYDLWEETLGLHFFTVSMQLESLKIVIDFYQANKSKLNLDLDDYFNTTVKDVMDEIHKYISTDAFITHDHLHMLENPSPIKSSGPMKNGLDIASIISVVLRNDAELNDEIMMNTFTELSKQFREIYPINKYHQYGVAMGRYPEDVYDGNGFTGGNPWFISTTYSSCYIMGLVAELAQSNEPYLTIPILSNDTNSNFWQTLIFEQLPDMYKEVRVPRGTNAYKDVIDSLMALSDQYANLIRAHSDQSTGSLSEQYNRATGFMQGARDLSWSHSAFVEMYNIRKRVSKLINQL